MNNKVTHLFMFVAGAVIASAATWKITKDKYEQLAQEIVQKEIDSYKEHLRRKSEKMNKKPESESESGVKVIVTKSDSETYSHLVNMYNGAESDSLYDEKQEKGEPSTMNAPYTISYDEFGENDYETACLTYYADKVLVEDITDEVVEDIDGTIGYDSLLHFGEYDDDMLYVRNDDLKVDYEISLSDRSYYSDVNTASE